MHTRKRQLFIGLQSCLLWAILIVTIADGQIQLKRPKGEPTMPNPSILNASRDEVLAVTKQMLETREIPLDKEDCGEVTGECTVVGKPVIFTRGITTRSQLQHYCEVPAAEVRNWAKGRYVLRVQIAPASATTSQVGVYARFEGMTESLSGSEWIPLSSKGELEDKLLKCIRDRIRGIECKDEIK
jgi:hypothetical protein